MQIPLLAIEHYLAGTATEEEKKLVEDWYSSFDDSIVEVIDSQFISPEVVKQRIHIRLQQSLPPAAAGSSIAPRALKWLAAAAFLGAILSGGYLYLARRSAGANPTPQQSVCAALDDVAPGMERAKLTLGDGRVIDLDTASKGVLARQGSTKVVQLNTGILRYDPSAAHAAGISYNTITVPRGGQYQLILPDGSKVWLNSASSLRFPTAFIGRERRVELTGEAYFEVEKGKGMPFKVMVGNIRVEDLGTHFNINAYGDESSVKTTLLEGSVRVSKSGPGAMLRPGQQAEASDLIPTISVRSVDVDQVVAWKNGEFQFSSDDIQSVMRELGRWYDVTPVYQGTIPDQRFSGTFGRNLPLSNVLKILELSDVHFKIKEKEVVIMSE